MVKNTQRSYSQRSFRPWPENRDLMILADRGGFSVSEILNELVSLHFKRHIARKTRAIQRALLPATPAKVSHGRNRRAV